MNAMTPKPTPAAYPDAKLHELEAEFWRVRRWGDTVADATGNIPDTTADREFDLANDLGGLRARTIAGVAAKLRIAEEYQFFAEDLLRAIRDKTNQHTVGEFLLWGILRDVERMARLEGARRPAGCTTRAWTEPRE
jgi:hypothetical protein